MLMFTSATGMYSPSNIDWTYLTQNGLAIFYVKVYTTHIQSLMSSYITWVHITSIQFQSIKILIHY